MKKPNPIQFYVGLVLALGSAALTFFGSFHPSHTIVLIIGIALNHLQQQVGPPVRLHCAYNGFWALPNHPCPR